MNFCGHTQRYHTEAPEFTFENFLNLDHKKCYPVIHGHQTRLNKLEKKTTEVFTKEMESIFDKVIIQAIHKSKGNENVIAQYTEPVKTDQ